MRQAMFTRGCLLAVSLLALTTGCSHTTARPVAIYNGELLARPARVFVVDFDVSPGQVSVNRGLFESQTEASDATPPSPEQIQLGQEVARALAEELVKRMSDLGLPAERAPEGKKAEPGTVVIEGQFVSIDEGSRAQRLVVGFGAGGSELRTLAQVYVGAPSGPVLAATFETKSKSSRIPGLVAGGPTVVAGRLVVAGVVAAAKVGAEVRRGLASDAERTADELGKQLREFFVALQWIPGDVSR